MQEPSPGDQPDDPGPLARQLSTSLRKAPVKAAMRSVADWQLARMQKTYSQDWTFAALYVGLLAASDTLHDARYSNYVADVAKHYDWNLGPRKSHADDQAIGQSYLWLYSRDHEARQIASVRKQFDDLVLQPDETDKPVWWWCDALFMAPPVWAELSRVTRDDRYLNYLDREWHITADLLWDPDEHFFYRDKTFLQSREKNGRKVFWSRGNGWVMAGLVRVLASMPESDPRRAYYVTMLRQMAGRIKELQGKDGLWRPGLLDPESYPYPEVSGSAFYVYALAWGIHHKILDRSIYLPVVSSGWAGLVLHIYRDGRLGSIQPIGAAPGAYKPSSSYVFGVGAFLLAGSEAAGLSR